MNNLPTTRDPELTGMLADLRASRPAAYEVGLAALRLGIGHPDELAAYLDQAPPPGPDAADEDLLAWAGQTDRLAAWLDEHGEDLVEVHPGGPDLRLVEVPRP